MEKTVANPFQEITDRLIRMESSINELKAGAIRPENDDPENDLPINVKEAARITGLAIPTLYTKISRRTIPAHRQAGRIYFFKSELLDWIRSGRRKTVHEIEADAMHSLDRGGEG